MKNHALECCYILREKNAIYLKKMIKLHIKRMMITAGKCFIFVSKECLYGYYNFHNHTYCNWHICKITFKKEEWYKERWYNGKGGRNTVLKELQS